jgi:VanZ like family
MNYELRTMNYKKLLWWIPTIVCIVAIIFMATQPVPRLPAKQLDKVVHVALYGVLAFLLYLSLHYTGVKRTLLIAILIAVLVGAVDESLQALTKSRHSSIDDFFADLVGAAAGGMICRKLISPRNISFFFAVLLITAFFRPYPAQADELDVLNRPVNVSGLTGMLVTTSPYTTPQGVVELGISGLDESSIKPVYSQSEFPLTITVGLTERSELALRGSYWHVEDEDKKKSRGAGDAELSWKWNFITAEEYSTKPAVALIIAGIFPTAEQVGGFSSVVHWGARAGLSGGIEITWEEHVMAIYADVQLSVQDLSDEALRDRYHTANAGLLFPVSKHRNIQLILEYNIVSGKDQDSIYGLDHTAVTPGIRLVSEGFNFSMGMQFLRKERSDEDNSTRVIGTTSIKF